MARNTLRGLGVFQNIRLYAKEGHLQLVDRQIAVFEKFGVQKVCSWEFVGDSVFDRLLFGFGIVLASLYSHGRRVLLDFS